MKKTVIIVLCLALLAGLAAYLKTLSPVKDIINPPSPKADVSNIPYTIENESVTLVDGKAAETAPDSASQTVTQIFGEPSAGDIDLDGTPDAAVFLTQSSGGSGTFYYVALVLTQADGTLRSLPAIFLGDRIAPQSILIRDGVAMVNYAARRAGEPMSAQPSLATTKYVTVEGGKAKEFNLLSAGEQLFAGNLIMAPEARIFTPCNGTAHWVIGTSTAYADLMKAYDAYKSTTTPYSSVYAVVSGVIVSAPADGFGADYSYGIDVKNLIKVLPGASCR
jgi:hypothetical protein